MIPSQKDPKTQIQLGIKAVYDIVKPTYGPRGKNSIILTKSNGIHLTKDGVTVGKYYLDSLRYKEFTNRNDKLFFLGCLLVMNSSQLINHDVGDGTTTSCLLTYHLTSQKFLGEFLKDKNLDQNEVIRALSKVRAFIKELSTSYDKQAFKELLKDDFTDRELTKKKLSSLAKIYSNNNPKVMEIIDKILDVSTNNSLTGIRYLPNTSRTVKVSRSVGYHLTSNISNIFYNEASKYHNKTARVILLPQLSTIPEINLLSRALAAGRGLENTSAYILIAPRISAEVTDALTGEYNKALTNGGCPMIPLSIDTYDEDDLMNLSAFLGVPITQAKSTDEIITIINQWNDKRTTNIDLVDNGIFLSDIVTVNIGITGAEFSLTKEFLTAEREKEIKKTTTKRIDYYTQLIEGMGNSRSHNSERYFHFRDLLEVNGIDVHLGTDSAIATQEIRDLLDDTIKSLIAVVKAPILLRHSANAYSDVLKTVLKNYKSSFTKADLPVVKKLLDFIFNATQQLKTDIYQKDVIDKDEVLIELENLKITDEEPTEFTEPILMIIKVIDSSLDVLVNFLSIADQSIITFDKSIMKI